jgi:anti-sigma factor RsiW
MTEYDATLEEDLSALLDGELSAERESELRARVDGEPALAARLAELERIDVALRAMPREAPSPELRASLRARLEGERTAPADNVRSLEAGARFPETGVRPLQKSPRLAPSWISMAIAAAAALALYLAVSSGSDREPARIADSLHAEGSLADAEGSLADATDEEIGIALEYETLADLDVIEDLELLELLVEWEVELEEEEAEQG